ncbi:MAG: hypothetical protein ACOX2P_02250 [Bacillota bacterium]
MDKEQKKRKKRIREETSDVLGSAPMTSLRGQPFFDADGEKTYIEEEVLDEKKGKTVPERKQPPQ